MKPIKKMTVFYEDGSSETFTGSGGKCEIVNTVRIVEEMVEGKMKPHQEPVRYVNATVIL